MERVSISEKINVIMHTPRNGWQSYDVISYKKLWACGYFDSNRETQAEVLERIKFQHHAR